jgi:hypothetical protein
MLTLDDVVLATYCALDDALKAAGIEARNGKLIPRRGGAPEVDDREVLCLAVLQELLGFESDHSFYLWLQHDLTMRANFPRLLSRQNFSDRRTLLTPILQRLCAASCELAGEGDPPFSSSIRTRLKSAGSYAQVIKPGSEVWRRQATATRCGDDSTVSASI